MVAIVSGKPGFRGQESWRCVYAEVEGGGVRRGTK